jgi:transcriptional antiterminator NusG
MNYYVLQVKTTGEEFFITEALNVLQHSEDEHSAFRGLEQVKARFFFPKRRLLIRRQGKRKEELKPTFPGYIFLEAEAISPELYRTLKRIKGFQRFLKSNQDITALSGQDLDIITKFLAFGPVAEISKVYFDENDRIVVTDGPMQGLEGSIVKVDKRKKRVKVRVDFSYQSFMVDLGIEVIEKADLNQAALAADDSERRFLDEDRA